MSLHIRCFCLGQHNVIVSRRLQRELKLMCERNGIRIPVQRIEINQSEDQAKPS